MSTPTLGAYVSAFNVVVNGLDYETPIRAALAFFDFVTVAVNTSTDDTLVRFEALAAQESRLKVVSSCYAYTDITFDGAVKNAALQACEGDVLVQMDLDESVPLNQYAMWRRYAAELLSIPGVDCFALPSVDLWGSIDTIRADKGIGLKFRMHKRGLKRGVRKDAWRNGKAHFDTSLSDSCELLDAQESLARAMMVVPHHLLNPGATIGLNGYPYTLHYGYLNFEQRVRVNRAIWADHWPRRSGHAENVVTEVRQLEGYQLLKHRLNLA